MRGISACRFPDFQTKSAGRFTDSSNLLADLLTVTISAGRFANFHQICQQKWGGILPSDIQTVTKSAGRFTDFNTQSASSNGGGIYVLADLLTVAKSAGKFADIHTKLLAGMRGCFCWQIYGLSPNLAADYWVSPNLPAEIGGYIYWQIYWLWPNLLADMVTFTKCGSRNEGKHILSPNLPADLLTVSKSAGRFAEFTKSADRNVGVSISAGRLTDFHKLTGQFTDCHQICWQKWGDFWKQIYWLLPNLLAEMGVISARNFTVNKSTGRLTDFHTNSSGRFPDFNTRSASRLTDSPKSAGRFADFNSQSASRNGGVFLPAGLLTVNKSACRFTDIHSKSSGIFTDY